MANTERTGLFRRTDRSRSVDHDDEEAYALLSVRNRADLDEDQPSSGHSQPFLSSPARKPPREQFVEAELGPTDTLQSVALKYSVPIAELKRVNNLHKDNEVFGLRRLKIPVKPMSLLTEMLPEGPLVSSLSRLPSASTVRETMTDGWLMEHFSTPPSASQPPGANSEDSDIDLLTSNANVGSTQMNKAKKFLQNKDKELAEIRDKTQVLAARLEADHHFSEGRRSHSPHSATPYLNRKSIVILSVFVAALVLVAVALILAFGSQRLQTIASHMST
jgi:LysM repeat protein